MTFDGSARHDRHGMPGLPPATTPAKGVPLRTLVRTVFWTPITVGAFFWCASSLYSSTH